MAPDTSVAPAPARRRPPDVSVVGADRDRGPAVASVAKAALLLQTFTPLTTTLSVRQLAERTGIPRSTVHGLCSSLCDAGLLEHVRGRGYQLGPTLVTLGGHVIDRTGLVTAAERPLATVQLDAGEEVHLAQLVESWVVYLDRRAGVRAVPMRNRVGLRALAHRTGCGRAALAALPSAERRRRVVNGCRREHVDQPPLDDLDARLDHERGRGYVISSDFHPGRTSIAAAVLDAHERPVGGVSIAAASTTVTAAITHDRANRVTRLATDISQRLVDASSRAR